FRIAPRRGIDQITKIIEQARIRLAQWIAAAARPANAIRVQRPALAQLDEPASDRTPGQASGAGDHADAATPGGRRLGRRETPPNSKRFLALRTIWSAAVICPACLRGAYIRWP